MEGVLNNKVFISTRPEGQNEELRLLIENSGAKLLEMPTIEMQSSKTSKNDLKILNNLNQFTWIIFSSANGIKFFFEKTYKVQGNYELPAKINLAVIGQKSENVLASFGHKATIVNPGNTSIEFGTKLMSVIKQTDNLLFPEGDMALGKIKKMLAIVANCTSIIVYLNKMPKLVNPKYLKQIINNEYDNIIVTSPSGFNNLVIALENKIKIEDLRIVSIGLTTTKAVRLKNVQQVLTAKMSKAQGIFNELSSYYKSDIN